MKRKAFIILGYCEELSLKISKCGDMYQRYFSFNMGGAWENNEIHILKEPNISDLKQIVNEEKPDYAVIVFIGHGANQDDRQLFQLNKDTIIQAGQFTLDVPKQLIIVESCRDIQENITFTRIKDSKPKFKQGGSLPPMPIGREHARKRFDTALSKTENGTSICFACSKDESAIDFCFSNALLYNSMQWHESTSPKVTLSISEIMQPTITEVNRLIKVNHNEEQLPELIGKGNFPFVVNKF
jgi:hypothetical protein